MSSTSSAPSSILSNISRAPSWAWEHDSSVLCDDSIKLVPRYQRDSIDIDILLESLAVRDVATPHLPPIATKSTILERIGEGTHARVHRALLRGRQVAAKIANSKSAEKYIVAESKMLDYISAQTSELDNIVEHYSHETVEGKMCLYLELADCDLLDYAKSKAEVSPSAHGPSCGRQQWISFAKQAASAISTLHRIGVVHGDIKPQNFLIVDESVLKLADFETAFVYDQDARPSKSSGFDVVGTNNYSAPELLSMGAGPSTFKSDVYALGVTLLVLATAEEPYMRARNGIEMIIQSKLGDPIRFSSHKSRISTEVEEIVRGCCHKDPSKRWDLDRVLETLAGF